MVAKDHESLRAAPELLRKGDIVLLKGSRAAGMERVLENYRNAAHGPVAISEQRVPRRRGYGSRGAGAAVRRSLVALSVLYPLHSQFSIFNVFRYLSFGSSTRRLPHSDRLCSGPAAHPEAASFGVGQKIREEAPAGIR